MEALLISFLYLCLHIAIILLVAYAIVWIVKLFGIEIDPMVFKFGKIIVMLLIIIAVVAWLFGVPSAFIAPVHSYSAPTSICKNC